MKQVGKRKSKGMHVANCPELRGRTQGERQDADGGASGMAKQGKTVWKLIRDPYKYLRRKYYHFFHSSDKHLLSTTKYHVSIQLLEIKEQT